MAKAYLGIDLGGTQIKTAVVSAENEILGRHTHDTPKGGPESVVEAMVTSARESVRSAGVEAMAAGIGAPGPMDWRSGVVFSPPNLPGWHDVPLAKMMQERLEMPCFVDNDANLACLGEFEAGAGRGVECMCMLTLGTGVGGGIVVFGKLLRGIDGTAAEIGHMTLHRDGRQCGCGAKGCLEAYASVTGLVRTTREAIEGGRESSLTKRVGGDVDRITGKMISDAAHEGDALAKWAIEETGDWIGVAIATLINLLNPEKVVLGGGMIAAGEMLFRPIRERALRDAFQVPAKRAQIVRAELGEDAGVFGAAAAARERSE